MSAADRQELRELVEAYALAVDRRDSAAAAQLFTPDGQLAVWLEPGAAEPFALRRGRDEIAAALDSLRRWQATHHAISAAAVTLDEAGTAIGETTCIAHHFDGGSDEVLFIHYDERFARTSAGWRFARRELRVQWRAVVPMGD